MLEVAKKLRKVAVACDASDQGGLWLQLQSHAFAIAAIQQGALQAQLRGGRSTFAELLAEGTLLDRLPALLQRLTSSAGASSSSSQRPASAAAAAASAAQPWHQSVANYQLLGCLLETLGCALHTVMWAGEPHTRRAPAAAVARCLDAAASTLLFSVLATILRVTSTSTPPVRPGDDSLGGQQVCLGTASSAALTAASLLYIALRQQPVKSASPRIAADLAASCLLRQTCLAVVRLRASPAASTPTLGRLMAAADRLARVLVDVSPSPDTTIPADLAAASMSHLLAEPAVAQMWLSAVCSCPHVGAPPAAGGAQRPGDAPHPGACTAALARWMTLHKAQGITQRYAQQLQLTSRDLAALTRVDFGPAGGAALASACGLLMLLVEVVARPLSHAAFEALAGFAMATLEGARAAGGDGDGASGGRTAPGPALSVAQQEKYAFEAVRQALAIIASATSADIAYTLAHEDVRRNAQTALELGLVGRCEAWLRTARPDAALAEAISIVLECACNIVTHSAGSRARRGAAFEAYLSLAATARKVILTDATPQLFQGFSPCNTKLITELCAGPPPPAGLLVPLRSLALQILPLFLQGWASVAPVTDPKYWDAVREYAFPRLLPLHEAGLSDVTTLAGAPGALLEVLRVNRRLGRADTFSAAALTVHLTAAAGRGWLREGELLAEASACLALPGAEAAVHAAVQHPDMARTAVWWQQQRALRRSSVAGGAAARPHTELSVHRLLCDTVADLRTAAEGLSEAERAAPLPTWDSCLLASAVLPAVVGGVEHRPLVGCWNYRCPNLSGDSEAALPLKLCNNCRTARYCSNDTCQRRAWAGGHRTACGAWCQERASAAAVAAAAAEAAAAAAAPAMTGLEG